MGECHHPFLFFPLGTIKTFDMLYMPPMLQLICCDRFRCNLCEVITYNVCTMTRSLKGLAQAKIIKKSVILIRVFNMTI